MRGGQVLAVSALFLEQVRDGVCAETVDPLIQPEPDDVEKSVDDLRVLKVQVGLVAEEPVPEELPPDGVEGPVGFFGVHKNDAGILVLLVGIAPDVEVAERSVRVLAGLLEPRVLVRGVVQRQVDDHADAAGMGLGH
ncbi:hypothetical protein D9M68_811140 [compost metagenome]